MTTFKFKHIANYLKRNKLSSFVNILGLSVGFTVFLLLGLYIKHETSFDRFYKDTDRTYRCVTTISQSEGASWHGSSMPPPMKAEIESQIPELENVARIYQSSEEVFEYENKVFEEEEAFYADQNIVDILDLQIIEKNKDKPLNVASSIIVSESTAKRYFGNNTPLGKMINLPWGILEVSGVYKDLPKNMHIRPELIISFDSPWWIKLYNEEKWDFYWLRYYFKVKQGGDPQLIAHKLTTIINEHQKAGNEQTKTEISLQPISDIYLGGKIPGERNVGDIRIIKALKGISFFLLLIVLINYINLASAQILERSAQVSIRKVLGISKFEIIKNFTLEAGLMQLLALTIAFISILMLVPTVNNLLGCSLSFSLFSLNDKLLFGFLLLATLLISVLYPIIIMFSFDPVSCLKGKFMPSSHSAMIRKGLIGFQYFISFAMIFGTLVFYRQSNLLINKDIGIDTRNMLVIRTNHADWNSFPANKKLFKDEMNLHSQVLLISNSNAIPGFTSYIDWLKTMNNDEEKTASFSIFDTDYDFTKTMGLKVIAGRELSPEYSTDINAGLISRSGLKVLGFNSPEEAIGKEVNIDFTNEKYFITGVIENFQLNNLNKNTYPSFIRINENQNRFISIRYNSEDEKELIQLAEENWKLAFGDLPFRYFFLDENYRAVYKNEVFQTKIITVFTLIAVVLAALGLFGMTYFIVIKREKEFSIRKVNGAEIVDIFLLVSKGFIALIGISSAIALPVAWFISVMWLNNYPIKIDISWWYYFIPFSILGMVTLVTISYHILKTAWVNPAQLLRNE
ncbi:MAG: ABC transporter permease [Prolixibacteraceae bacterium]|jgi:putative ABC transport system permease protein|nr:ABC transporter permease [Prolixibacteraceae bacterium]